MKIDVVIPTHNRIWALKRVLSEYLTRQEVNTVIVVDDGSTDGTEEWLRKQALELPRIRFCKHENNRGACAARNTGAALSTAPFIFFADDDMLLRPDEALSILIDELEIKGGDIIGPILVYDESEIVSSFESHFAYQPELLYCYRTLLLERKTRKQLIRNLPKHTFESGLLIGVMLVRRRVIENIKYDETLGKTSYRDETDFQLKAVSYGFRLYACPQVILIDLKKSCDKGGCHTTSLLKYELLAIRNNWRILKRHQNSIQNLGISIPIEILQLAFILEHMFHRLPCTLAYKYLQKLKIVRNE